MRAPKDPRSTQRKRARRALFAIRRPYVCQDCGRSPTRSNLPVGCPRDIELAEKDKRYPTLRLECNHINKNIMDNDPVNLEWLCPSCHKNKDLQTDKGVSILEDEYGYDL